MTDEEVAILKKAVAYFAKKQQVRYEFVYQYRFEFAVMELCQILTIS